MVNPCVYSVECELRWTAATSRTCVLVAIAMCAISGVLCDRPGNCGLQHGVRYLHETIPGNLSSLLCTSVPPRQGTASLGSDREIELVSKSGDLMFTCKLKGGGGAITPLHPREVTQMGHIPGSSAWPVAAGPGGAAPPSDSPPAHPCATPGWHAPPPGGIPPPLAPVASRPLSSSWQPPPTCNISVLTTVRHLALRTSVQHVGGGGGRKESLRPPMSSAPVKLRIGSTHRLLLGKFSHRLHPEFLTHPDCLATSACTVMQYELFWQAQYRLQTTGVSK